MIRSIRVKFTLWYIGSFFVLLLLSSALGEFIFHQFALESIDKGLYDGTQRLESALSACFAREQPQNGEFRDCFDRKVRTLFSTEVVLAQLRDFPESPPTTLLATSYALQEESFALSHDAYQALRDGKSFFETIARSDTSFSNEIRLLTILIHDYTEQPYILQFGIFIGQEEKYSSGLRPVLASRPHIFFIIFPILLLLTGLWGYFFMKRAFAPVHQLSSLAKNISAEDLSHRIDSVKSHDEIGELADTFNDMIARLEHSFQQIQQFTGDVSHELKTPLTAIKGEIEVALRKERSPEEYQQILSSLLEDSEKLHTIIENLLFLSCMDAHSFSLSRTDVALDEVLLDVYEEHYLLAKDKQIRLNLQQVDQLSIQGDAGLLKRVFVNLLMNAVRYTPPKGQIELSLEQQETAACFTISDTGVGIPEDSLPHIFGRFYRVDESRTQETGGSGLGLAIAQKIVEAHDGKIEVVSTAGEGTAFRVLFRRDALSDEKKISRSAKS